MTPADLRKYLESQGWAVLEAGIKDRLYVLEHADFPRRQLAYPMDMTAPDYDESVGGALLKLADITGRKIESLIAEIKMEMTRNDIINKLQAQGLRWIESQREEATLNEMEKVESDGQRKPALDAVQDAITTGTGIMRGGERIDPASIYKSAAFPGEAVISQSPKPVGYWVLYPGATSKTIFAIYKRPTEEQIKNTEQLLGWGWEEA